MIKCKTKTKPMNVIPVGRKVLIKDRQPEEFFPGTTIVRNSVEKDYLADVVAVGQDVTTIEIGQIVKYAEYAEPVSMKHNGENHLLINVDSILAIVQM